MLRAALVFALLLPPLAGCGREATPGASPEASRERDRNASSPPEADPFDPPLAEGRLRPQAETVFDAAEAVFDTLEPRYRPGIEIPVAPRPRPRPRPTPPPIPEPGPPSLPPPSPSPPVAGSCDVRSTEGFCFTYTGATWDRQTAENHCAAAPNSSFQAGECPAERRIATCVFRRGEAPARQIVYTYYEPYDLDLARIACPGRFTEIGE